MGSVREGMRSAFFQHQQSAHNVGNSPAYQNKKRPRGEFADGSSATQAEMEAEASAEVCGSAEDKERFEKYFDIPAAGVHYYYPASGRGPCPASHNVVSGVKANAATAVPVAAAAAAAPTATAASAGVSGSDNGAAFTGPMPPMPPKIVSKSSCLAVLFLNGTNPQCIM